MARFKTNQDLIAETKHEIDEASAGRGDVKYYKSRDGKNLIRIMPPYSEEGKFYHKVGYHRIGSGQGKENRMVCPRITHGKNCPICARGKKVIQARGKEAAKPYLPEIKFLTNVLDLLAADGVVYQAEFGNSIMGPMLESLTEDADTLLDLKTGHNFQFAKQGSGKQTRYKNAAFVLKPMDLIAKGYDENAIYEGLADLAEVPWKPNEDEVTDFSQRFFAWAKEQEEQGDDGVASFGDDDDNDPPAPGKGGKKPAARASIADDDDDAPDAGAGEEQEEEQQEEEAPAEEEDDVPNAGEEEAPAEEEDDAPAPAPVKTKPAAAAPAKPAAAKPAAAKPAAAKPAAAAPRAPVANGKAGHAKPAAARKPAPVTDDDTPTVDDLDDLPAF